MASSGTTLFLLGSAALLIAIGTKHATPPIAQDYLVSSRQRLLEQPGNRDLYNNFPYATIKFNQLENAKYWSTPFDYTRKSSQLNSVDSSHKSTQAEARSQVVSLNRRIYSGKIGYNNPYSGQKIF